MHRALSNEHKGLLCADKILLHCLVCFQQTNAASCIDAHGKWAPIHFEFMKTNQKSCFHLLLRPIHRPVRYLDSLNQNTENIAIKKLNIIGKFELPYDLKSLVWNKMHSKNKQVIKINFDKVWGQIYTFTHIQYKQKYTKIVPTLYSCQF